MNCPHCQKLADTLYCGSCGRFTTGERLFTEAEVRAAVEGELNDFELRLLELGNLQFECGEHNGTLEDYDLLAGRTQEAKDNCLNHDNNILARLGLNK